MILDHNKPEVGRFQSTVASPVYIRSRAEPRARWQMLLIFAAVFEKNTVELLDMVFGDRDGLETLGDHVHRIGVACDFLLVAACE